MFKKLKEKSGYVSIETIVIAGVILTLGMMVMINFFHNGKEVTAKSSTMIYDASQMYLDPSHTPLIDDVDYYN